MYGVTIDGGVMGSCAHALKELGLVAKAVKRGGAPAHELVYFTSDVYGSH